MFTQSDRKKKTKQLSKLKCEPTQALIYSASRTSKYITHLHSIFVSTYSVLFLGTPHHGSDVAKLAGTVERTVSALVPRKLLDTSDQLLNPLRPYSETLQNITDQFAPLMKNLRVYFFWEQEKTDLVYTRDYVRFNLTLGQSFLSTLLLSHLQPLLLRHEPCNHIPTCA